MAYCDDYLGDDVCYMHSGTNPVTFLRFTTCQDSSKVCYMGDNYAWLDSKNQFFSSGSLTQTFRSQVYKKNTLGYCQYPEDFRRDLLPGRNCTYDTQCLSGQCNSAGVCSGKAVNEPCSDTSECNINLGCIPSGKTFPWQTIYVKQCMKKFDISDGTSTGYRVYANDIYKDSLRNGLKCRSGICRYTKATECVCFSIANVTSDYGLQTDSTYYKCSAMSQYNFCQYYYVHDDDGDGKNNLGYLNMGCQCSLDGSVGYCPMPDITQKHNQNVELEDNM